MNLKVKSSDFLREEFTELVRWLSEKDWERWDKEIEADSEAGKLDFLVREALGEKQKELSRTCEASHNSPFLGFLCATSRSSPESGPTKLRTPQTKS